MEKPDRPRILVVDDTKENIETLFSLLADDYIVVAATDGENAIRKARKTGPDLILLDIIMPDMDGYEVCRRLKAEVATAGIPVIFVTALSEATDEARGFKSGAVDYITKPFVPAVVMARVRTHLALREHRTHLEDMVRQRTRQLEETKIAAQCANKAKSEFLINMGHELKTPLNGILAASGLIPDCDQRGEREEICGIIRSSGESLLNTVNNILEFTRSKDSELRLEHLPFRLDAALSKLRTRFFHKGRHIRLSLGFDPVTQEIPNALVGDEARLTDIINHLLENAAKFTTKEARATFGVGLVRADAKKAKLLFSVEDRGIGIAGENLETIFDPFCQVDTSITRSYDGVGIGLSICKQMVRLMGGRIWVDSELGRGSTFRFSAEFDRQDEEIPFDTRLQNFRPR